MKGRLRRERIRFYLLGMFSAVILLLLLGVGEFESKSIGPPNYGRYQLSAWGTALGSKGGSIGAFVIDTATGETRTVYSRVYGSPGPSKLLKNNLKRPFHSID